MRRALTDGFNRFHLLRNRKPTTDVQPSDRTSWPHRAMASLVFLVIVGSPLRIGDGNVEAPSSHHRAPRRGDDGHPWHDPVADGDRLLGSLGVRPGVQADPTDY